MRLTLAVFVTLGFTTLASAQPVQSKLAIAIADLSCSTPAGAHTFEIQSWAFSAANPPAVPGAPSGGAGHVQITALTVNKSFDECSSGLFAAVAAGKHFSSVILTQSDPSGRAQLMTVQLGDVSVSNYQLGGSNGSPEPIESVSFSFSQITIINPQNNSRAGWDLKVNHAI